MTKRLDKVFLIPVALIGFILLPGSTAHSVTRLGRINNHFAAQQAGRPGPVKPVSAFLITDNSVGPVRLGITVAQARRALRNFRLSRTTDGEGVALIAVKVGARTVMTLYAGEEDARSRINERAKLEFIEVLDVSYHTADGVHPKMPLAEVEQKYGKLKEIMLSEIEAREFATFASQPAGFKWRVTNADGMAGIYSEGLNTTTHYNPSAFLRSITISSRRKTTPQFSSRYTDLKTQCKNPTRRRVEGQHTSRFCEGYGGFQLHIFDAATTLQVNLESLDRKVSLPLAQQSLSYGRQVGKIEWRLANGRPFAIIMRVFKYSNKGEFPFQGEPIAESLLVKGLPGFAQIDYQVDAAGNANEKARELADRGYAQQTAPLVTQLRQTRTPAC